MLALQTSCQDYPPYQFLKQVVNHCPKAASVYMDIWERRDEQNCFSTTYKKLSEDLLISKPAFKSALRQLCKEGLLNFCEREVDGKVTIELVDWDSDFENC